MKSSELFDLPESLAAFRPFFLPDAHPWEWLPQIKVALESVLSSTSQHTPLMEIPSGVSLQGPVFLDPTVKLPPFAVIQGPAWIGRGTEIRPGCYIRGNVITGEGCVLGNSCEYKNCLLMDNVETAHYNYVGDSILGNNAHLGAGVICANLKLSREEVTIRIHGKHFPTGLKKIGGFIGEGSEIGCNSVLQPGSILGKQSAVLCLAFGGYLAEGQMAVSETRYRTIPRRILEED